VADFNAWLKTLPPVNASAPELRCLLSLAEGTQPLAQALQTVASNTPVCFLSGPEGGLNPQEDALARAVGFVPVTLGPRVLRAETAALAALVVSTTFAS
jgi:16S rRNA (uracil1498-N3)-methyltransferase